MVGGLLCLAGGLTGKVVGGAFTVTGIGAAVGVPAIVVSAGLVTGGVANMEAGLMGLLQAFKSPSSGGAGPPATPPPGAGATAPGGSQGYPSFTSFKRAMGPAGPGKHWHHMVEQTPGNVAKFGPQALHNTKNVIPLNSALHNKISGFYSSIRYDLTGSTSLTVRQWLSTQSYGAQTAFGKLALQNVSNGVW